jgi:hypothetical protein
MMVVTFDSNVWRKVASPDNFPKDPDILINKKLNNLINAGTINAYLSETIFTLEAIKRIDRKEVFKVYKPNFDVDIKEGPRGSGEFELTFTMGPSKNNQPVLNDFLREHLNDAVTAGFKIISFPRTAGFVNAEVEQYIQKFRDEDFKEYYDKACEVAAIIEDMNCGFKWVENIGLKYDKLIFVGLGNAPDFETINIANAVAEWADGDTVACAVGIKSKFICTNDTAKAAGKASVFSQSNIEVLSDKFNFTLIKPKALADMF